jgi:hypothetical protein
MRMEYGLVGMLTLAVVARLTMGKDRIIPWERDVYAFADACSRP